MRTTGRWPPPARSIDQRGFQVVEIMIALIIVALGLLAVVQMIPEGMTEVSQTRSRANAVQAGQRLLETLRTKDFSDPQMNPGSYADTVGVYAMQWTIADDIPLPGCKEIAISVTWPQAASAVQLETYIAP